MPSLTRPARRFDTSVRLPAASAPPTGLITQGLDRSPTIELTGLGDGPHHLTLDETDRLVSVLTAALHWARRIEEL